MMKFKGYEVTDNPPEDAWLKGYFYVNTPDIKGSSVKRDMMYRDMGYMRHKDYVLNLLGIQKGEKVLDIGCEDGAMLVYCGLLGAVVTGVDLQPDSIKTAESYIKKYKIDGKAITGDARKLQFPDNYFDRVISSDFFEHLSPEDNVSVLKEACRVVKPGGIIIIKTPNLTYLRLSRLFKMAVRLLTLRNPFSVVIAHTTGPNPDHIGLATKKIMTEVIRKAGFLNYEFNYDVNSKLNNRFGEYISRNFFLRDLFTEDLIVKLYKPVIMSLFEGRS